jgi:hypothetical protein
MVFQDLLKAISFHVAKTALLPLPISLPLIRQGREGERMLVK